MVQAELQNGRWAMLGVAGILFTAVRRACDDVPHPPTCGALYPRLAAFSLGHPSHALHSLNADSYETTRCHNVHHAPACIPPLTPRLLPLPHPRS